MSDKLDIARFHQQYPSARRHGLSGKVSVGKFLKWIQSPEGSLEMACAEISSMYWMKKPGLPAHEYLIIYLGASHWRLGLRVERDTDSWSTLFLPKSRSNCKDTINFDPTWTIGNTVVAGVMFENSQGPKVGDLGDLLQIISESADYYNVWTLNCWWFVSCVWTNLVRSGVVETSHCDADVIQRWNTVSGEGKDKLGMDPVKIARVLQFIHVAGLQRALGDREGPRVMEKVSERIQDSFDRRSRALRLTTNPHTCTSASITLPYA
ncbi:hypothetical protein JAAARDRAFT_312100 [Jaapia argillacea MUCL 33604]|uniref:Uncharacterized protein n=1 Tax=Jaapia argillacea MUCL 33604 TaxID=933084 RepID=A0A067PRK4_9AGAM|nr:hypothetical protein JAAARDRAFT_312100 [Jaapia argillacea MUCL 33604]